MRTWGLCLALSLAGCDFGSSEPAKGGAARKYGMAQGALVMRVQLEIKRLRAELEQYHALRGEWPPDWEFTRRSARDPWGEEYLFEIEDGRAFVFSAGPDREPGTDDDVGPADH